MTSTEAEKREAFEAFEKATGGKVVKVETGQKVKAPEKIALVEAAEQVPEPEPTIAPAPMPEDARDVRDQMNRGTDAPASSEKDPDEAEEDLVETVPEPKGEGITVPIVGDVTLRIWIETGEEYRAEFRQGDRRLFLTTTRTPPWNSPMIQKRWANLLIGALGENAPVTPASMAKKVTSAFNGIAEKIENDPDAKKALTSAVVRRVLARTTKITVYPSKNTTWVIEFGDKNLTVPIDDMSRTSPEFINRAWLNLFQTEPLNANKNEWLKIQAAWTDPAAAEILPIEETSEDEIVIERLRIYLESITLVKEMGALTVDTLAWYDESTGWVWVINTRIARFIEEELKKPVTWTSALSRILRACGLMPQASKTIRIGDSKKVVRCWPFLRDFAKFNVPAPVTPRRDE